MPVTWTVFASTRIQKPVLLRVLFDITGSQLQNCNRLSFLIEVQNAYVTNLNNNFSRPSRNSQLRIVLS